MISRTVAIIGIGSGNPDQITIQAIDALNRSDVLFIPNKGADKAELAQIRREICDRYIRGTDYRLVEFDVPRRGAQSESYQANVREWHDAVEAVYRSILTDELDDRTQGAFLVWGDPTLYDSTLRILDRLRTRGGIDLQYEVIPGISSVQALAARHRVALNNIGASIDITTGRQISAGFRPEADSVVVMLDGGDALRTLDGDLDVYWGAYVGTADEVVIAGRLRDVLGDIEQVHADMKRRKGWIMDTYLLKKRRP